MNKTFCGYCSRPYVRDSRDGWHGCNASLRAKDRLATALLKIDETVRGGREHTGTHAERERLNNTATAVHVGGGRVQEDYYA